MILNIKKLNPNAKTPTFGTKGAACFDLYASEMSSSALVTRRACPLALLSRFPRGFA